MPARPAAAGRAIRAGGPLRRLAAALALAAATPALAGPPYVTDDPEPTDDGRWEDYGFASGTRFAHATQGEAGFDINYGAAPDLQASAVISADYAHEDDASHAGLADTEIGLKYRFLHQHEGSWLPDVAVFPKLELPTAGHRFGSGRLGAQLPIWAEKDIGGWSIFGGGGWQLNPGAGNRDYGFGGLAVTHAVTKALSLGVEGYTQGADAVDGRSTTGIDLGAQWQVAPHWSLIGSGGPIVAHRAASGDFAFYVALEFHN